MKSPTESNSLTKAMNLPKSKTGWAKKFLMLLSILNNTELLPLHSYTVYAAPLYLSGHHCMTRMNRMPAKSPNASNIWQREVVLRPLEGIAPGFVTLALKVPAGRLLTV